MIPFSGHMHLRTAARTDGRTALAEQSFRAPYHLSKPYWDADTQTLLVQVVNPTAGILAGDRLESAIIAGAGTALLVTTPSATRVFMMDAGTAECRQHFAVHANGWLEVSPEPLVPHRGAKFHQATTIDVAPGGGLFLVDQLLPGRIGFGEKWEWADLRLELTVRSGGELILRERFAHSGCELEALAAFSGSGTDACFANAILIAPDFAAHPGWSDELNRLQCGGDWIGVSALRSGGWTIKMITPNPLRLRELMRTVRSVLAGHFPRLKCDARKL